MKTSVKDLTFMALMVAITAICAWITIPVYVVPFTMQTFAVFATLLLLGGTKGTLAILAYLLLGTVGVPVFAGFSGGVSKIVGPTGGYLIGFVFQGLVYIVYEKLTSMKVWHKITALVIGLFVCYLFGTVFFVLSMGKYTFGAALGMCVLPYIVPDLAKLVLAWGVSTAVSKALSASGLKIA